jgi:Neuraminidase (sialidase)
MALNRLPMRVESNTETTSNDKRSDAVKTPAESAAINPTILKSKPPLLIQFLKHSLFGSTALALTFLAALSARSLAQNQPPTKLTTHPVKSKPDVVIYRGTYPGWPWVTRTPDGKLVCVWREGERHLFSAEGKLMLSTSADQGRTWSEPRTFYDEPGIDDRNVAILALSNTDWLVAFNTYTADINPKSRVFTLRTGDGGQSWSKPQLICDFDARTRAAPLKLSTGELVLPFYREPNIQSFAAVSSNNGKSWTLVEKKRRHVLQDRKP